jgi:large subunit ribosomal protein L32
MAVPKHKTSKARKRTRSSHNFLAHTGAMTECPQCHAICTPHAVCGNCGYYKGTKFVTTRKEEREAKKDAKK